MTAQRGEELDEEPCEDLDEYLRRGGKLTSPANAPARYRAELLRLMAIFVDSEMAGASGFADCINFAPGLSERRVAARIVYEKFGHAAKILALMDEFGADAARYVGAHRWNERLARNTDLGTRRAGDDMRLNVFHYPIEGWVDAVTMNVLMGRATVIQLEDWTASSYQPLADATGEILPVEARHADYGETGLRNALATEADRARAQASVDYWLPRVAASFGSAGSASIERYRAFGLRQRANEELLSIRKADIAARLEGVGLAVSDAQR